MRFFPALVSAAVALFIGGFAVFVGTLPRAEKTDVGEVLAALDAMPRQQVGIVALTGGGGARIERALDLFREGNGDRVLISGTNPQVTKSDLAGTGDPHTLSCCVDLGTRARTTIGNGIEARDWAISNGYDRIILVTSDFHLPRALLELRSVAPDIDVIGVPVRSKSVPYRGWMSSPKAWKTLSGEYLKFLASLVRTAF